jgi:lysophospholipase L1-like esterase
MPAQNRARSPVWRLPGNRRKFLPFTWYSAAFVLMLMSVRAFSQPPVTIHLAGDSTMAEKLPTKRPETGWGERLQSFLNDEQVEIKNYAKNGRSTRTFMSEGLWADLLAHVKPGDYVFIQFGHNDESKEKVDRYTPPEDYRNNLVRFIADVRGKQAFPVLLTPLMRRRFDAEGKLVDTHGEYPDIVRSVAADSRTPLIDMHRKSAEVLERYGPEHSRALFLQLKPAENPNYPDGIEDNTHFSPDGAQVMAELAVNGSREARLPFAAFLKDLPIKDLPIKDLPIQKRTGDNR